MTISTIRAKKSNNLSTILMYVIGIIGVALVVFFGGEVIKNLDNLKGKAALTADTLNATADVYINGVMVGTTPFESEEIEPGYNKVSLRTADKQYETLYTVCMKYNFDHSYILKELENLIKYYKKHEN